MAKGRLLLIRRSKETPSHGARSEYGEPIGHGLYAHNVVIW